MLAKALSTALVSGLLLTGAFQTASHAEGEGDGGPGYEGSVNQPFARVHNPDGSTVSVRGNPDGSRTITQRNRHGKVINRQHIERQKPNKKQKARALPSASATDPDTGVTTSVQGNPDGSRTITKTDRRGRVISKRTVGGRAVKVTSAASRDAVTGAVSAAIALGFLGLAVGF